MQKPSAFFLFAVQASVLASFVWGARMPIPHVEWTPAESAWMALHPVVRLGVDPNKPPLEFVDAQGVALGISMDVVDYLEKTTGIRFERIVYPVWIRLLDDLKNRELDAVATLRPTSTRREFLGFTRPYMRVPIVIAVRKGGVYVEQVRDLQGKRVGMVPGYSVAEYMRADSVTVDFVEYSSYREALKGLAQETCDAVLANLATLNYELMASDLPVHIVAPTRYESVFAFGVRKDWPELVSILDKALTNLSEEEKNAFKNEWLNAKVVLGTPFSQVLAYGAIGLVVFGAILLIVLRWNRRLGQEIEERKRAQALATGNANKFSLLFNNMDQAFSVQQIVRDGQGQAVDYRYLEVNPAFCRLFGMPAEFYLGKTRRELPIPVEESWIAQVVAVAETGKPLEMDYQLPTKGRWLHYSLFSPGHDTFACTVTDITEQKDRMVHMTSHLEEMSHFIYSVSHDLNGPNLTIGSFARMLQEDLADCGNAEVLENLGYIVTASQRMSTLLEGLLSVARVGPRNMERRRLYLGDLALEAGRLVGGLFQEKHIALEMQCENIELDADHDRMLQVFQNLFENAAKYMGDAPSPSVHISVRTQNLEKVICISDNGMGIPAEKLQSIFDLFVKVDKGSQGTGIGLALVKRIIEAHGGRIWAESAGPGLGSTFCFTLGDELVT